MPRPKWLAAAAACASVVLLLALIILSERYVRLRRHVAEQGLQGPGRGEPAGWEDDLAPISLEGEGRAMFDRLLPRRPRNFLLAVALLAVACWAPASP